MLDMSKERFNEDKRENGDDKKHISINIGLLAGLLGGALLGILIGTILNDIPFYTGFGMVLGMAISIDMVAHIKHKREKSGESDGRRQ